MREVWFRRVLWGYFPVSWKGFLTLVCGITVIVPSFVAGLMFSVTHPVLSDACYVLAAGTFLGLFLVARWHSE